MEGLAPERTLTELAHGRLTHHVQRHACVSIVSVATISKQRVLDEADIVHAGQTAFRPTPSAGMLSAEIAGILFQAETSGEHAM
jgi:hypothetical protein